MNNFILHTPTKIVFGKDEVKRLSSLLPKDKKILLLYGGGSIKKNGVYDDVINAMDGLNFVEFGGIEANPDFDTCVKARNFARQNGVEFLLSVGGGSVLDATKFISLIFYENGDEWEVLEGKKCASNALPLASVMTLPATGSEMNNGGVISRRSTQDKLSFKSRFVFPKFSIIDPSYTASLPLRQIQNGIVDTFVHTLEQYATWDINTPMQDLWAIGILRTLLEEGPKAISDPSDYDVMSNICWCATCGLNGWIGAGVIQDWAVHMIGHELTAFYGIDHAQSLAVVLPSRYRLHLKNKKEKLYKLGVEVFKLEGNKDQIASNCIDKIEEFFNSLGVKTHLSDYGIDEKEASIKIAERFIQRNKIWGEHSEVTPEVVRVILINAK